MGSQEEQSHKRKSDEAHKNRAHIVAQRARIRASAGNLPPPPDTDEDADEDDEDKGTRTREADAPAPSPKERQLNRPTASTTDATLPSSQNSKSLTCAGCGSSSHRLNICMKAGPLIGLMRGCPWCNTLDHSLTNCPDTKHDLAMQLELVQMRANMPYFQPTQKWVDVVCAAVADGHKPPTSFPWTTKFTRKMHKVVESFQQELDEVGINRRVGLPIDPSTKDWETVQRNFPEAT